MKGTATRTGRCGILGATDVFSVQGRGNGWKLKSTDLPRPTGVDYTTYNDFLIEYQGRWI